ncbi:MAG: RloB domain-containing protein, partial [Saezia sp.]
VCFEVWLLAHFENGNFGKSYECHDNFKKQSNLSELLKGIGVSTDTKSNANAVMSKLVTEERVKLARAQAKRLCEEARAIDEKRLKHEMNPYTDVYELLDAIDRFKEEA